jgi:hypothetical protein
MTVVSSSSKASTRRRSSLRYKEIAIIFASTRGVNIAITVAAVVIRRHILAI